MLRTNFRLASLAVALVALCQGAASADESPTKGERIWSDITVGHYTVPVTVSDGDGNVRVGEQQYEYETGVALVRDGRGCKVVSVVRDGDQVLPAIVLDEAQNVREVPAKIPRIRTIVKSTDCGATPEDVRRIAATP